MKKKPFKKLGLVIVFATGSYAHLFAQNNSVIDSTMLDRLSTLEQKVNDTRQGEDHFMVVGLATFGFVANKTTNTLNGTTLTSKTNSLADADNYEFSPMLLWRHGTKFLMEF